MPVGETGSVNFDEVSGRVHRKSSVTQWTKHASNLDMFEVSTNGKRLWDEKVDFTALIER